MSISKQNMRFVKIECNKTSKIILHCVCAAIIDILYSFFLISMVVTETEILWLSVKCKKIIKNIFCSQKSWLAEAHRRKLYFLLFKYFRSYRSRFLLQKLTAQYTAKAQDEILQHFALIKIIKRMWLILLHNWHELLLFCVQIIGILSFTKIMLNSKKRSQNLY